MKTAKQILEYYGQCCVSEHVLIQHRDYPDDGTGRAHQRKDSDKLENIRGQKKAIEWMFNEIF